MNLSYLTNLALEFRSALLKCDKNFLVGTLRAFPKGSCGEASKLLAKYFKDMDQGVFYYVCGEVINDKKFQSHAWLEKEDVIVDITADQFEEIKHPVIVTTNNSWYKQFGNLDSREINIENYNDNAKVVMLSSYRTIINNLKKEYRPKSWEK